MKRLVMLIALLVVLSIPTIANGPESPLMVAAPPSPTAPPAHVTGPALTGSTMNSQVPVHAWALAQSPQILIARAAHRSAAGLTVTNHMGVQ